MKTERFFVRPKADLKALEDAIIDWIDALRAERGLPPLADSRSEASSRGGQIRTADLTDPNRARYQTALRPASGRGRKGART